MSKQNQKKPRLLVTRRSLTLGSVAAVMAGASAQAATIAPKQAKAPKWVLMASGEGEGGEGESGDASLAPEIALLRDLGFMQGHLRAGLALYEAGDRAAAKTHMGHPIKEKYGAVAASLAARGSGHLQAEISALAEATEAEESIENLKQKYAFVAATIDKVRNATPAGDRLRAMVALTRIAGDEYSVAVEGGQLSNLHEYQDSWGFLQVVADETATLTLSADPAVAKVAQKIVSYLEPATLVFGDLQGQGGFPMDPSVIYGAAARMELAVAGLK